MHELGIARNIVAIVCEHARGAKITRVTLEVGELSGVLPDAIAFCFPLVAAGTACADAVLDVHVVAGRSRCRTCGTDYAFPRLGVPCPCGSRDAIRLSGDELNVREIQLEAA